MDRGLNQGNLGVVTSFIPYVTLSPERHSRKPPRGSLSASRDPARRTLRGGLLFAATALLGFVVYAAKQLHTVSVAIVFQPEGLTA